MRAALLAGALVLAGCYDWTSLSAHLSDPDFSDVSDMTPDDAADDLVAIDLLVDTARPVDGGAPSGRLNWSASQRSRSNGGNDCRNNGLKSQFLSVVISSLLSPQNHPDSLPAHQSVFRGRAAVAHREFDEAARSNQRDEFARQCVGVGADDANVLPIHRDRRKRA